MLVLTRKVKEQIVVDGPCTITILDKGRNGSVKLGFEGEAKVLRTELLDSDEAPEMADGDESDLPASIDERAA